MMDDRPAVNAPVHIAGGSSHSSEPAVAVIPMPDVEPSPAVAIKPPAVALNRPAVAVKPPAIALKPPAVAEKPPAAISSKFWAGLLKSQRLKLRTMANRWDGSLLTRTMFGFRRQAGSVADSVDGLLQRAAQGIEWQWRIRLSKDPQGKTRLR